MSADATSTWKKTNPSLAEYTDALADAAERNTDRLKVIDFARYAPTPWVEEFLVRYELVRQILDVPGDIWEFGVCGGKGFFAFHHALSVLQPKYDLREIIGFDTSPASPAPPPLTPTRTAPRATGTTVSTTSPSWSIWPPCTMTSSATS